MTDELETLVRRLQDQRAQAAPDPERTRRALPALIVRRRRRRVTRAVIATAVAVVVLAVGIPVTLGTFAGRQEPARPSPSPAGTPGFALLYSPDWMPAGFVERIRGLVLSGPGSVHIHRRWSDSPELGALEGRYVSVEISERTDPFPPASDLAVDVNGVTGTLYIGQQPLSEAYLRWQIDATHMAGVSAVPALSREDMLRIGRSLRPDRTVSRPPLRLDRTGPLPEGKYDVIADDPGHWMATTTVSGEAPLTSITSTVGLAADAGAGGDPVRVRGTTGRLVATAVGPRWLLTLLLTLPDGRPLTVRANTDADTPAAREALIRLVDGMVVDPAPDLGWAGR